MCHSLTEYKKWINSKLHVEISTTRSCDDTEMSRNWICGKHRVCELSIMHSLNKLGHVPICFCIVFLVIRQISWLLKWEIETSYGWVKNEHSWFSYTSWHWKYSFRLQKGIKLLNHHTLNLFKTISCRQKCYMNHSYINIVNQTSPLPFLLSITT